MKTKTIVLTGGGTAGHIMPNIALIDELKKHFDKIIYIGSSGMEKDIVKKYNMFSCNPYKSKSEFKNNLMRKCSKIEFSQAALKLLYDFLLKYYAK